jgi:hypothetical protein
MRIVPTASKKLFVAMLDGPLASEVRRLMLLCPLINPEAPMDDGA